jgi:hypothetical protein
MTPDQIQIAKSFNRITFQPGTHNKRFAQSMIAIAENKPEYEISSKQEVWLYWIIYTFRRQIPDVYEKFKENPNCKKK